MAKPVDKFHQVRYKFCDILIYLTYLIIPRMVGSSEPAFPFWAEKWSAAVTGELYHTVFEFL